MEGLAMKKLTMMIALLSLLCSFSACKIKTYEDGFDDGYKAGYEEGHEEGYEEGRSKGYHAGYKLGRSTGYDAGYYDGYRAAGGSFADDLIKKFNDEHPTSPQD